MKCCNVCKQSKPFSEFFRCKAFKDGYDYTCKACNKARRKAWAEANRERAREIGRESARRRDTPQIRAERAKKLLAKNPNYWNERAAVRYAKNPAKLLARDAARRALKLQATPAWADMEAIARVYVEAQERSRREGIVYHVDHIVPLKSKFVCGLHVPWNLQVMLGKENHAKNNRHWPDMPAAVGI